MRLPIDPRALAIACLILFAAVATPAAQRDLALHEDFAAAEGKGLDIDAVDLDVRVRVADVARIDVAVELHISGTGGDTAERWIESRTPRFRDSADRLQVEVAPEKTGWLGLGKLTARARLGILAPGFLVPDVTTTSGNISIHGDFPHAEPLFMRSSSGTVSLVGAAVSVDARTVEGDIDVEVIRPLTSFVASTSSGNVRMVGGARTVSAGTASGNIWLEDLSGALEATTATGKITVTWDRLGPDQTVRIRSSSGRVHLMIPRGVSPRGRLTTTTGSVRSELPGEVVGDGSTLQLAGDGPEFDVETASGEIVLGIRETFD
jgi:hypothetical protein